MRKFLLLIAVLLSIIPVGAQDADEASLRFGMVLVGMKDDGGWSQAHYEGGQYAAEALGAEMLLFENYNEANENAPTLEQIIADFVEQGASFIMLTSEEFEEEGIQVARVYSQIPFVQIAGDDVLLGNAPSNMSNLMGQMEFGKILGGCAAALTTETGRIGYLGAMSNNETRRLASSAYLGASYCWTNYRNRPIEELHFELRWVGFWFYIPSVTENPTQLAFAMVNDDVDVIIAGIDTPEAANVANEFYEAGRNVRVVTYNSEAVCRLNKDVCIGNMFFNWGPAYVDLLSQYQAGDWRPVWDWARPKTLYSSNSIVGFSARSALPTQWRNELSTFTNQLDQYNRNQLRPASIPLWQGPLVYRNGRVLAEDGEIVNMLDIWYLADLLQGITLEEDE